MDLDETVYALTRPGRIGVERYEALFVSMRFDFFVGVYFGFKNCAAPSMFQAHMLKEYNQAYFGNIGYGFPPGFLTNMKVPIRRVEKFDGKHPYYGDIRRFLLNVRAEIKPRPILELEYDSTQHHWRYEPIHRDLPKEETSDITEKYSVCSGA